MNIKEVELKYRSDIFQHLPNAEIVSSTGDWHHAGEVTINAPIAIGWMQNGNLLILNTDGNFIFDVLAQKICHQDLDSTFHQNVSDDNLFYTLPTTQEQVSIFGLRGGDGNRLTKDNRWMLEIRHLSWNVRLPWLHNSRTNSSCFLELKRNDYEGYIYAGFSKSENHFAIMGDHGIDLYSRSEVK